MDTPDPAIIPEPNPQLSKHQEDLALHIEKFVNKASFLLHAGIRSLADSGPWALAPVMMFRHVIGLMAAIAALVRAGWSEQADSLLRALFESVVQLQHALKDNREFRGWAFLVAEAEMQLKNLRRLDRGTSEGKQVAAALRKDEHLADFDPMFPEDVIREQKSALERRLTAKDAQPAVDAYRRLQGKSAQNRVFRNPPWYALDDEGLLDLERLAARNGWSGTYEILYRQLSATSHGKDILRGRYAIAPGQELHVFQLRWPGSAQHITVLTTSLAIKAMVEFAGAFIPDGRTEVATWYATHVRAAHLELVSRRLLLPPEEPRVDVQG